ncbi:MAG: TetR/AcrR family transcriptional regulator [Syntrophomonas sp.]|nr:TetR/AcrR family transcriptional regulator [Syntrophomonas sp.]
MGLEDLKKGKRELIMEAAIKVFSRKGYNYTKMEEIAIEAGIGKGTIYEYFASKLQLLQEILERSFQLYHQKMVEEIQSSICFKDKIRILVEAHFKFCQENKELTSILFWNIDYIDEELRAWGYQKQAEKERHLREFIQMGIDNGEIRPVDTKLMAVILGGILGSIWVPLVIEGWEVDKNTAAEQITQIIMNGIGN